MREVLVVIANLFVPGSAQVARDEMAHGVVLALGFGISLAAGLFALALAPALLGRAALGGLFLAAFGFWLASQLLHVRALRSGDRRRGGELRAEALAEVTRLWLRGERAEASARLEPMLRRWPRSPALHFVAAQLWAEGRHGEGRARAREFLELCRACDLEGRWRRVAERELSCLAESVHEAGRPTRPLD